MKGIYSKILITILSFAFLASVSQNASADPGDLPAHEISWGSAGSGNGQFSNPLGVAVAENGNVYVADGGNNRLQIFDADGGFISTFGSAGTGNGQFNNPQAIAFDYANDWFYVMDNGNARVQKFDMAGTFLLSFSETPTSPGNGAWFNPHGLWVDPYNSNVFVSLPGEARVDVHNSSGVYQFSAVGLNAPRSMVVIGDSLYVADQNSTSIAVFDRLTGVQTGNVGTTSGARGLTIDYEGYIYVAERNLSVVQKIDPDTNTSLGVLGSAGTGNGQFNGLYGAAFNPQGNILYTTELAQARVQKFVFADIEEFPEITDVSRSGSNVTITFTPVATVEEYELCYGISPDNSTTCVNFVIEDPSVANEHIVEDLDPYTSYTFRLRAENSYSDGPWTEDEVLGAEAAPEPEPEAPADGELAETGRDLLGVSTFAIVAIFVAARSVLVRRRAAAR